VIQAGRIHQCGKEKIKKERTAVMAAFWIEETMKKADMKSHLVVILEQSDEDIKSLVCGFGALARANVCPGNHLRNRAKLLENCCGYGR